MIVAGATLRPDNVRLLATLLEGELAANSSVPSPTRTRSSRSPCRTRVHCRRARRQANVGVRRALQRARPTNSRNRGKREAPKQAGTRPVGARSSTIHARIGAGPGTARERSRTCWAAARRLEVTRPARRLGDRLAQVVARAPLGRDVVLRPIASAAVTASAISRSAASSASIRSTSCAITTVVDDVHLSGCRLTSTSPSTFSSNVSSNAFISRF